MTARYLVQIVMRCAAVVGIGWLTAIALWPWLQIGNPLQQFKTALVHFANMPMAFEFPHWGERIWTNALPRSYIPNELLARLPEAFLILLAVALVCAIRLAVTLLLETRWRPDRKAAVREAILALARERGIFLVCLAVILPLAFLIVQRATIYDGVRHVLFVIPMLALLAGVGLAATLPLLGRAPLAAALVGGTYAGVVVLHLARLHPLEYVAINAFAGGTREAYDKFEQDYWSAAATEGLRRLERRLDYEPSFRKSETPPSILICIPWRDRLVGPMLQRPWVLETDPDKADFIIATQRWRCADGKPLILIDEVKRFDRTFAWVYKRTSEEN
jgi:hypothetical protein